MKKLFRKVLKMLNNLFHKIRVERGLQFDLLLDNCWILPFIIPSFTQATENGSQKRTRFMPQLAQVTVILHSSHSSGSYSVSTPWLWHDCSGWTFNPCSADEFGLTPIKHSGYSQVFWMLIWTLYLSLPPDAALEGTPLRYEPPPKERVGLFSEDCETMYVTAPSVHIFNKKIGERLGRRLSSSPTLT